jgi:hypothetical protein
VPQLWDTTDTPEIDLAIHIGMAGPRLFYSLERRGHRDGYVMQDVDGEFLGDGERRVREGEDWVWSGAPAELESEVDVEDVLGRWRGYAPVSFLFLFPRVFVFRGWLNGVLTAAETHGPENLRGRGALPVRFHLLFESGASVQGWREEAGGVLACAVGRVGA